MIGLSDKDVMDLFLQLIENSSKVKGAEKKCFSSLLYLFYLMFELFHEDVCKLSRYGQTSYIVLQYLIVGVVLAFLAGFADGNEAIGGSLCHSFMAKSSSVDDILWQDGDGGSFMEFYGGDISRNKVGGDKQANGHHSHLLFGCCNFSESSKFETWRNLFIRILFVSSCSSYILMCKIDVRNSEASNLDTILYINYERYFRTLERRSIFRMEIIIKLDQSSIVKTMPKLVEEGV
ncbi:hypothetical protein O6H91_02G086300 [Diphasiastrum complanatum]|uniref:Uncharacterized protein n=1 Tax=Diphasiastrum complanatum TaxID=34168 RepID=A0ACC2EHT5_DIPCM|nr:hypothetical protein O6H91_02G086300 [Diphasiastrum complanatum]